MLRSLALERIAGLVGRDGGLTSAEVEARLRRYGRNRIVEASGWSLWDLARDTLADPMLWFLLGTGILFAAVGERTEAFVLLIALVPFLGMDAFLHRRTRASVEGLSSRLATLATVERDGERRVLPSIDVVPGDLVLIGTGEAVPADGVLVGGTAVQVDESTLTGEAYPVRKTVLQAMPEAGDEARVDAVHWTFAGTRLLAGAARVRVVYTGGETLYGEIVRSVERGARARTPLQHAVANLVSALVVGSVAVCLALAWVRYEQGHGVVDALLSALTLAVAALPEEFPVVLTFFLGVGVYRLAQRQALVRRAVVVENVGRVSCICSDKTGTVTEGRLRLAHQFPAAQVARERLLEFAAAAARRETGDPLDIAILDEVAAPPAWLPVASFPFTEDRKRETVVMRANGRLLAAVKGAPEVVLAQCDVEAPERAAVERRVDELARAGHKVIACAWRDLDGDPWPGGEPDRGFRLAGVLAFEDPVRPGVREALETCRAARIRVIMVTGDHPATARAVAAEVGLGHGEPRVLSGDDMEARLARGDRAALRDVDVIARAVPAQKLALVRALQGAGEIVAVTGDGVNDVPALQAADVGIAMGERGTRSARETAAIVLLDDNFRTIVRAIAEGRQLFANLRLSFEYLLMIHVPLVATAALIPLAGYPLLYLPVHVVLLEIMIHPTALLVFQALPPSERIAPGHHGGPLRFFSPRDWLVIGTVGILVTAIVSLTYLRSLGVGVDVEHSRAMALVALTTAGAAITAALSRLRVRVARIIVGATLGLSVLLVQVPRIAASLHLAPLHLDDWALALGGGALVALVVTVGGGHPPHAVATAARAH